MGLALVLVWGGGSRAEKARAQEMASYYDETALLTGPPASFREGLLGYANPALPAVTGNHALFAWATEDEDVGSIGDWAALGSVGGLGAGLVRRERGTQASTGFHLSLAGGSDAAALGLGFQGFAGDADALGRVNRLTLGTVLRPSPYLSLGLVGNVSLETDDREVVGELGLRPLGTSRLTLFADAAWPDEADLEDVPWSVGASVELVRGVDLVGRFVESRSFAANGRVVDDESWSAGLRVELGRLGLGSEARTNDAGYAQQINRIRVGRHAPSALGDALREEGAHVPLRPGRTPYRAPRFALASDEGPRFYDVLRTLRQVTENDRVSAVALDLSALNVSREQAWELRRAVERVQSAEKSVVAFLEGGGVGGSMNTYHLASAADRVVMDPRRTLVLPGYATSRTYLRRALDTLGLGVQTFRHFDYKSAYETFSRTGFSEADSLQRQELVDDWYALTRRDIAESRDLTPDSLDRIIDEQVILDAEDAKRAGLVDTLGRWPAREGYLSAVTGTDTRALGPDRLDEIETATRRWGTPPEIAVVYGIGATSIDGGMQAKSLAKTFRRLASDDDVEAVVFRVDSPGGSALAADIVAEAVRDCAEQKPVLVSQGTVAASGGYLASAFADRIFAGPNTVTGSIGVIGLWIYEDGLLSERANLDYDVVQRGERADLFAPYRLPFLGLPVPARPLSDDELERVRRLILRSYDDFVRSVAAGRDTTEAYVREVGEGRVYSGQDALGRGLVDELGGLARALVAAERAAELRGEEVRIREVNATTGLVDLPDLLPFGLGGLVGAREKQERPETPSLEFLRTVLDTQPQPLMILPPDYYVDP